MNYPTSGTQTTSPILYVGLDVDDTSFHGCALTENQQEGLEFKTKSSSSDPCRTLEKFNTQKNALKICYEAGYLGYSLQRELQEKGYRCEIVAPSLIPHPAGKRVKTDRLDARGLARYYAKGLLTTIHVPSPEQEAVRDLLRSRCFLKKQIQRVRHHFLSCIRRLGLHYRQETANPDGTYWTKQHRIWLKGKIEKFDSDPLKLNFTLLLSRLEALEEERNSYEDQIENLAKNPCHQQKIRALTCYRGIDTLAALSLVSEIGDIRRFDHPRRLTSYCGMDIIEHSSGGKERKFCMSKMGNKHIRTCVIEACQFVSYPPLISKILKERRKETPMHLVQIADRCMQRLYKKSRKMLYREKPTNKVKAACARELLGFIWESLRAVTA